MVFIIIVTWHNLTRLSSLHIDDKMKNVMVCLEMLSQTKKIIIIVIIVEVID